MSVSREEVLKIAQLAELEVDEETLPALAEQMSRILAYEAQISGVAASEAVKPFIPGPDAVRFRADEVKPIPNSSQFVFPAISAPAARSFATAVDSNGERYPSSTLDPQVVVNSSVQMLSLTATGMPYSTPEGCTVWACRSSELRNSLGGVIQALSRLALMMRSAAAFALASASLVSVTRLPPPQTARASARERTPP